MKHFNIDFGYPRTDTCSTCDATKVKIASLELQIDHMGSTDKEKEAELKQKLKTLQTEDNLHKIKAQAKKREEKKRAKKSKEYEAITMDFCKNLPTPNITTNDAYYKRQLTFISFNIHVLSTNRSIFYKYPLTVAKKRANKVMSFLYNFCCEKLDPEVKHLRIFL